MRKLTQLQYKVIFLYSKGLTFKEIDTALVTTSKGVYMQVVAKDKGRVTRAKISRQINLNNYKQEQKIYLDKVKKYNKTMFYYSNSYKDNYILPIETAKANLRTKYIIDSIDKSCKSYNKYKLTFLKNNLEKVA